MILKKNAFSYVIWLIILCFTGAVFSFFGMISASMLRVNVVIAAIGFVVVFFGVLFLIYILTGLIGGFEAPARPTEFMKKAFPFIEWAVIVLGIVGGVIFRAYMLPTAGEEAAYFEVSKVTDQGGILVQSVQGSVYYYCLLLHGLFLIVGNHWIAGIWLQIVLQMIGAVIVYQAMKRLAGHGAALIVYGFILFAPSSMEAGINYSPQILYFCLWALVMFFVADYLKRSGEEEAHPALMWVYTIVVGLVIGICCYVDVTGWLLLLLAACLPMVRKDVENRVLWMVRLLVIIGLAVGTFCFALFLDSVMSGTSFVRVLNAWLVIYGSLSKELKLLTEQSNMDLFVVIGFICLGVFSFWRRKDEERFTPFVLMVIGVSVLCLCGITTENMNGSYMLHILFTMLAAVSLTELFYTPQVVIMEHNVSKASNATENKLEIIDLEKQEITKEGAVVSGQVENTAEQGVSEVQEKKPRLIENPLPGPKKHVHKTMDYAFTPDKSKMYYDVRVADSDDYDLK